VRTAVDRGTTDNITVVVVYLWITTRSLKE
jgi:serine/threonine protein phosphatase PrpC